MLCHVKNARGAEGYQTRMPKEPNQEEEKSKLQKTKIKM